MLKVGITGGIGSGKSTVCRIFEVLGIPVFYADTVAKEVMHTDDILVRDIINTFGPDAYSYQGELNRKYLADIVFKNKAELDKLNALVHPAVFRAFETWASLYPNASYVIKEAALMFESGSFKLCDYNVLVLSPADLKIRRVMERDAATQDEVESRMNKQFSDEEKARMADFFIRNNEKELLIPQVLDLNSRILAMTKSD